MAGGGNSVLISIGSEFDSKGIREAQKQLSMLEKNIPTGKFQQFGESLQLLGGRVTKLGGSLTRNLTLPIAAAGAAIFVATQKASDLNESITKTEAVFGSSADEIMAWSKTSATALGQSQQQALEAASTYGNLFQAFGLTREQAVGMSMDVTELAADLASFNNVSVDDAILALRSGLSGETEPLKRFGIALNDQRLRLEAARLGLGEYAGTLPVAVKAQAAYSLILKDSTLAQGDFARTSDGLANQQRILKAEVDNAVASFGEAFLPILLSLVSVVRDRVIPIIQSFADRFKSLSEGQREAIIVIGGLLAALGPALLIFGKIIGLVGSLIVGLGSMGTVLTFLTGPIGLTIAAVAALTAGIVFLYRNNEDFRNFVRQVWSQISEFIGTAVGLVRQFLDENRESLEQLRAGFMQLVTFLSVHVGPIIGFFIQNYLQSLIVILKGVIFVITQMITTLVSIIDTFKKVSAAIGQLIRDFQAGFNAALTIVRSFRDGITNAFSNAGNLLYNIGRDIVMGLWRGLQSMTGFITTEIGQWVNRVIPEPIRRILRISSPSRVFEDIGTDLVDGLVIGLDDNAQRAIDAATDIARGIETDSSFSFKQTGLELARTMAEALLNEILPGGRVFSALMDAMDTLAESLNRTSVVTIVTRRVDEGGGGGGGGVGGGGASFTDYVMPSGFDPNVPIIDIGPGFFEGIFNAATPFARGGIVTAPTIGLVGEAGPEAVIPLNRAGGMMGNIYNITVNPGLSTNADTGRAVVEAIKHYERISGKQFANA
jgi:phage-related protein